MYLLFANDLTPDVLENVTVVQYANDAQLMVIGRKSDKTLCRSHGKGAQLCIPMVLSQRNEVKRYEDPDVSVRDAVYASRSITCYT